MKFTVDVKMKGIQEILKRHGLDKDGDVQRFHTMNVNRRIGKYMPHLTGTLETKLKLVTGNTEITVLGPYAKYQYHGLAMAGPPPKVATDKPLQYTKNFNPQAGPYWDRALVAAEGKAMEADTQEYIRRRQMPND